MSSFRRSLLYRTMSTKAPSPKPFRLALVQLGQVTGDKQHNLQHAREMVLKAAKADGQSKKPDLIVLPVRSQALSRVKLYTLRRGITAGMLQFALWCQILSAICRDNCIHSWQTVRH
jgi:hypothetical protein